MFFGFERKCSVFSKIPEFSSRDPVSLQIGSNKKVPHQLHTTEKECTETGLLMVSEMEYIHLRHNHKVVKESTKAFQKTHALSVRLANFFHTCLVLKTLWFRFLELKSATPLTLKNVLAESIAPNPDVHLSSIMRALNGVTFAQGNAHQGHLEHNLEAATMGEPKLSEPMRILPGKNSPRLQTTAMTGGSKHQFCKKKNHEDMPANFSLMPEKCDVGVSQPSRTTSRRSEDEDLVHLW